MYKYLLFSEPQSLVFYSSATALAQKGFYYFAVTKMKQLIFRSNEKNSTKANLNLGKALHLSKTENVSLLKVLDIETSAMNSKDFPQNSSSLPNSSHIFSELKSENDARIANVSSNPKIEEQTPTKMKSTCSLLMGTSKLNFFVVLIDLFTQKILEIQKVNFGYKSSLKRLSSNSIFMSPSPDVTLLICANFIFYLTHDEPRFKLLKILKEKTISLQIDLLDPKKIYILGKKNLIFGKMEELPGGRITFQETMRLPNKRKFVGMKAMKKKLIFYNKYKQIRIYELDKQDFTYKIEILQSFKQPLDFSDLCVINEDVIAVHDQKYLYCLSLKMNRIWQIVNLNDSHFAILPNGEVLTLQPKSENLFSVAQIKIKTYQKSNKINKYLSLNKYEKLKIIFAYLTRKFLKIYKFQDYNKVIYDLLLKMNLSNGLIKQPEFKAEVLKFYNLITDFSLKVDRSAVKGSLTSLNHPSEASQPKNLDSGSAYECNKSGPSSTSQTSNNSPIKKKNMNYLVVKPFINIRLPRKNGTTSLPSDEFILQKIMVKGQKHYQKFLKFKEKDPYPNDSLDSVYARYQSRLQRIKFGKHYLTNYVKVVKLDLKLLAEHLFFFSYKFNMKNNIKVLHCIFIGFDLWLWMSPLERKFHYQVLLTGVGNKVQYLQNHQMVEKFRK